MGVAGQRFTYTTNIKKFCPLNCRVPIIIHFVHNDHEKNFQEKNEHYQKRRTKNSALKFICFLCNKMFKRYLQLKNKLH